MYRQLRLLLTRLWVRIKWAPPSIFPARRVYFEVTHSSIGDKWFVPEVYEALKEAGDMHRHNSANTEVPTYFEKKTGTYVASNGVIIRWSASRMGD